MLLSKNKQLNIGLALALTVGISAWATPEKASAQSVLDIVKPVMGLFKKDPVPAPNLNSTLGTNNMNGNNMNVCLFPCGPTPGAGGVRPPQQVAAPGVPVQGMTGVPQPGSGAMTTTSTSCVNGQCNSAVTSNVRPNVAAPNMVPQQQQQRPAGPSITIPPIPLNLGL
jgi:hypothetical protein